MVRFPLVIPFFVLVQPGLSLYRDCFCFFFNLCNKGISKDTDTLKITLTLHLLVLTNTLKGPTFYVFIEILYVRIQNRTKNTVASLKVHFPRLCIKNYIKKRSRAASLFRLVSCLVLNYKWYYVIPTFIL